MPQTAPTYVSATGQLATPPLTTRIYDALSDAGGFAYLFVDTLVTVSVPRRAPPDNQPFMNPNSSMLDSRGAQAARPPSDPRTAGAQGNGGAWGQGRTAGGGGGRGGGGFMSMSDLNGREYWVVLADGKLLFSRRGLPVVLEPVDRFTLYSSSECTICCSHRDWSLVISSLVTHSLALQLSH